MQTRTASLVEQLVRVAVNFLLCSCISWLWLPYWGLEPRFTQSLVITIPFTLCSVLVGYALRRVFTRRDSD